jgi:hypothetical protein
LSGNGRGHRPAVICEALFLGGILGARVEVTERCECVGSAAEIEHFSGLCSGAFRGIVAPRPVA